MYSMVKKTISMPEELAEFVDNQNLNLSGFVQDNLRERKAKVEKIEANSQ